MSAFGEAYRDCRKNVLPYLYLMRFPLLSGAVMFLAPWLAHWPGPRKFVRGIFTLESAPELAVAIFWTLFCAMGIVVLLRLIFLSVPLRNQLPVSRTHYDAYKQTFDPENPERSHTFLGRCNEDWIRSTLCGRHAHAHVLLAAALVLGMAGPIIVGLNLWSVDLSGPAKLGATVFALLAAIVVAWAALQIRKHRTVPLWHWCIRLIEWACRRAYGDTVRGHILAGVMALLLLFFYVAGWPLFEPPIGPIRAALSPTISFVVIVLVGFTWIFTWFSLKLDVHRIPVEFGYVIAIAVLLQITGSEQRHAITLRPDIEPAPTANDVCRAWAGHEQPVFTIVAASGGGIASAYWSTLVMTELDVRTEGAFARSLGLVSATSGGALGTMHFVDAYRSHGGLAHDARTTVPAAAGESSLAALAWGIAYPDFLRIATGGVPHALLANESTLHRGTTMERRWQSIREQRATSPSATLAGWEEGVRAGWRPAVVFNATTAESGAPFRLGTVDLRGEDPGPQPGSKPKEFVDEYPRHDIDVVTAVRLSATFPWVTPITSPVTSDGTSIDTFHLADGGYFDNFGIYSVVDFLDELDPDPNARPAGSASFADVAGTNRILLIEIRSGSEQPKAPEEGGWQRSVLGPIMVMNNVRGSSQVARNDRELEALQAHWASHGVTIERIVLTAGGEQPTSWHLSNADRASIRDQLGSDANEQALDRASRILAPQPLHSGEP